jgi:hypothetical protein
MVAFIKQVYHKTIFMAPRKANSGENEIFGPFGLIAEGRVLYARHGKRQGAAETDLGK